MALLDDVIEASGGMECWNRLKRFTLQLSIDGVLFSKAGQNGRFKDIVAEGSTQTQLVRFMGFSSPDSCGVYQPQCVTIEDPEGRVLRTWSDPQQSFCDHAKHAVWDELHMVFLCGFSVWNYLTTPFLLARPEIRVEELPPWPEHGQLWRRLRIGLPLPQRQGSSSRIRRFLCFAICVADYQYSAQCSMRSHSGVEAWSSAWETEADIKTQICREKATLFARAH